MNEVLQAIKERRSVRKYKPDMVPQELIDQVIEAGLWAATGKSMQSSIIVAVTNKAVRDKLSAINAKIMGVTSDPFYGAPVVLIVLAAKSNANHVYDGSLSMGNMMLAAHALGLGSCWINRARQEFELPEWQRLLQDIGVEGEYEGIGHCVLGYVDGAAPAPLPRKANRVYYVK